MILLWQGIEDIDRKGKDKEEKKSIGREKSGLVDKDFEGEIYSVDIGNSVDISNVVDVVELSSFIYVSLFFSWNANLSL